MNTTLISDNECFMLLGVSETSGFLTLLRQFMFPFNVKNQNFHLPASHEVIVRC